MLLQVASWVMNCDIWAPMHEKKQRSVDLVRAAERHVRSPRGVLPESVRGAGMEIVIAIQ